MDINPEERDRLLISAFCRAIIRLLVDETDQAKARLFWIALRKGMIEVIRAIEIQYKLESCIVTNEQRKALHQLGHQVTRGQAAGKGLKQ